MIRTLLLFLVAVSSGCHWVLPLGGPAGDTNGDGWQHDAAALDVASLDAALDGIGPKPGDAAPPSDGPAPDVPPCPVEADPVTNSQCASICPPTDCDGLPDYRDPWPTCNKVFYADGFADPTCPDWGRSYCDEQIEASCGLLHFDFIPQYTLWAWVSSALPGPVPASHLVEARVVPVTGTDMVVWLKVATSPLAESKCSPFSTYNPGQYRSCRVRLWSGMLTLFNKASGMEKEKTISPGIPSELVIQSYVL